MNATWSLGRSTFFTSASGAAPVNVWSLGCSTMLFTYSYTPPSGGGAKGLLCDSCLVGDSVLVGNAALIS